MHQSVGIRKIHQYHEEWRLGKRDLVHQFTVVNKVQGVTATTECNVQFSEMAHKAQTSSTNHIEDHNVGLVSLEGFDFLHFQLVLVD